LKTVSNGPLEGLVVVEFGNFVAGPTGGQLLTDLGATVIKIEPPMGEPRRIRRRRVSPGLSHRRLNFYYCSP
jgi:formyl-CoA transferase